MAVTAPQSPTAGALETLGEALFALSDRLRHYDVLSHIDAYRAYERVVAAFEALSHPSPDEPMLTAEETDELVARINANPNLHPIAEPQDSDGLRTEAETLARIVAERMGPDYGDGFWRTCSGCHESVDGYDVGHYPHSLIFNCKLGGGCSECGGIGAVWDTTDYGQMGRDLAVEPQDSDAAFRFPTIEEEDLIWLRDYARGHPLLAGRLERIAARLEAPSAEDAVVAK